MSLDSRADRGLILGRLETLSTRILRDGPFDQLDAVGWIIRLAKGLEPIHALGVAHGSITGDAITIETTSPTSRGFLVDARRLRDFPSYHSPERADGERISPENDTWAVAVILYLTLTGTLPFPGRNDEEVKEKIDGPPPSPLAVFDVGDEALQAVVERALQRELAGRLNNLRELREALEAWHPEAKALPPLEDDEELNPLSGAHPVPSDRATPIVEVDAAGSFAMPLPDDEEEVTKVRSFPSKTQQPRAVARATQPGAAPGAGRPRPVRLPPVTPPPPKSMRGTLLGMSAPPAPPPADAPTRIAPPPLDEPTQIAAPPSRRGPPPPPRVAAPHEPTPPPPAVGLSGTLVLDQDDNPFARPGAPSPDGTLRGGTGSAPRVRPEAPPPLPARAAAPAPPAAPLAGKVELAGLLDDDDPSEPGLEVAAPVRDERARRPDPKRDSPPPDDAPVGRSVHGPVPIDSPAVIPLADALGSRAPDPAVRAEPGPRREQPVSLVPPAKPKRGFAAPLLIVLLLLLGGGAAALYRFQPQLLADLGVPGMPSVTTAPPGSSAPASAGPTSAATPAETTSAAPPPTSSAAPPATGSAAPSGTAAASASPGDVAACLFPLFAENTFVDPPTRLNTICQIGDPRKGGEIIRTEVILAGERRVLSDGMREWAILGWYEMPAFGMLQEACCPSHPELDIPITMPPCEIEGPLNDLIKIATSPDSDDAKVKAAVKAYTREAKCIARAGASDSYGRKTGPQGGEDVAFKKTLDRVRAAAKKKK
jgi:hypothetical protein